MLRTLATALALAAVTLTLGAAPAQAESAQAAEGEATFTPSPVSQFTVPEGGGGTLGQQRLFLDTVIAGLNAMPTGSAVTISMYSLSDPAVVDAMLDAHKNRAVKVRYMTWDQKVANTQLDRLRDALGTNTRKDSWFKMCRGSCARSGDVGAQHAKIVAFSTVGAYKKVTIISSGNLTRGAARTQWNEFQTIDDDRIYTTARAYVFSLTGDRDRFDFPAVSSADGKYRLSFFPRKNQNTDPVGTDLGALRCRPGDRVDVAMALWTDKRIALARRLVALKKAGCRVRVLMNSAQTERGVEAVLRKGIGKTLYDSAVGEMFVHTKTTVIAAHDRKGRLVYRVWAGSPNFSWSARYLNSEALLRINGKSEVTLHQAWFTQVLAATNARRA
jgi:hypothetical protein